jgi:beta-lactamase class A
MRPVVLGAALGFALAGASALSAQGLGAARPALLERIAQSGATVGLYALDLRTGDSLAISADTSFHAASTMKVPVMVQVFRDLDARLLRLDDTVTVHRTFRSVADSSTYDLDPADDSETSLYREEGRPQRMRDLVELMITVSSNLATNLLVERVGADRTQATLRDLGVEGVVVRRGVEDGPAYRAGIINTTTARGLGTLLAAIANGRAASAASCGAMVEILFRQQFRDGIPAGLPRRGVRVAHKTGEIAGAHHDGGIIYVRNRPAYVLVVLTRGLQDRRASATLIADLARLVHAQAVPAR